MYNQGIAGQARNDEGMAAAKVEKISFRTINKYAASEIIRRRKQVRNVQLLIS